MNTASIPSVSQSAMKDARPSASMSKPSDAAFGALLTAEIRQQQDSPPASPESNRPATVSGAEKAASKKEPGGTEKEASDAGPPKSDAAATLAVSPEILALMTSVEQLKSGAGGTGDTADVAAGSETVSTEVPVGKRLQPRDTELADALTTLPEDGEAAMNSGKPAFLPAAIPSTSANTASAPASRNPQDFTALLGQEAGAATSVSGANILSGSPAPLTGSLQPQAATATPASAFDQLTQQVGSQGWDHALGNKLVWMAGNGGMQSATLSLNPPELGPLKVVVNLSNANQASASFISAQPEVRQAIESALPRLRDMMNEAGIQLGQTTVDSGGQQDAAQTERRFAPNERGHAGQTAAAGNLPVQPAVTVTGRGTSLVDTFA